MLLPMLSARRRLRWCCIWRRNRWWTVLPEPNTLVVNLGDVLQVFSNDRYEAPIHRAITNSGASRLSIPFFLNPSAGATYAPLESQVSALSPARYRPISWSEFRRLRTLGDYADHGAEVQISDYRLPPPPPLEQQRSRMFD